jgi:hypothetical protein
VAAAIAAGKTFWLPCKGPHGVGTLRRGATGGIRSTTENEPKGLEAEDATGKLGSAAPAGSFPKAGTALSLADPGVGADSISPGPAPDVAPQRVAMPS